MDTLSIAELTEDERVGLKLLIIIDPGDRISNFIDLAEINAAYIYSHSLDLTIFLQNLFFTTIVCIHYLIKIKIHTYISLNYISLNNIGHYFVEMSKFFIKSNLHIQVDIYEIIILNPNQLSFD